MMFIPRRQAHTVSKRIVSFLPSATELLYELGAQDMLYGVTHECTHPEAARDKPRIINSVFDPEKMSSREIDETTRALLKDGKDVFVLDEKVLADARPDLIISQNTCRACAVHTDQAERALEILKDGARVYPMDPHGIAEILDGVLDLSAVIGKRQEGQRLQRSLEKRIQNIHRKTAHRPKVLALEWTDPPFTAGHWVPEMIETAGGSNMISRAGERSREMTCEEAAGADPDVIILMPCGFDAARAVSEYRASLEKNESWKNIRAVRENRVFAVDANSYFSKPSIRTVTGIEVLAKILHPDAHGDMTVPEGSYISV